MNKIREINANLIHIRHKLAIHNDTDFAILSSY